MRFFIASPSAGKIKTKALNGEGFIMNHTWHISFCVLWCFEVPIGTHLFKPRRSNSFRPFDIVDRSP